MPSPLDREESIEQAYFFRAFRERLLEGIPAQEALDALREELLAAARLPTAIEFLAAELKHSGLISSGMERLSHYFTSFQAFVVRQAEEERRRFTMITALQVLEREARYKSETPTPRGLFVYHFEAIARNRLGYDAGLIAAAADPAYDENWRGHIALVRAQGGSIDFCDLVYLRSELYVKERRRTDPAYEPSLPPLFGEAEGRIGKASRGRDPLHLFAALQRQLGYPEVPRPVVKDDVDKKLEMTNRKILELEARIKILEAEQRGNFDPSQFGKPESFRDLADD